MIKNTITYKNQVILTVYHKGFPEEHLAKKRIRKERIGRNVLRFCEEAVSEEEWNQNSGYAWEEKSLLTPKEPYNPYYEKACARMIHRIFLEKPSVVWKKDGTTIAEEEIEKLLEFVKRYTGMNLETKPVFLGDVFLFEASELEFHSNRENSVVLCGLRAGMKIIVKLKKGSEILETKLVEITEDIGEYEVATDCDWNNHDIEVFQNGELIFSDRDISYMRRIHMRYSFGGTKKRIPLTELKEHFDVEQTGTVRESVIGTPPEEVQEVLEEMNRNVVHRMASKKDDKRFLFVHPGDLDIAMKKITETMFGETDELWLFDAYFTDKGHGLGAMTDWLRLIANAPAKEKHITFYKKEESDAPDAKTLKEYVQKDVHIQDTIAAGRFGILYLHQTKKPIHDRFVLVRNGDMYSGISVGTSFNSLDSNHYCIHVLKHHAAKEVCEELEYWMETNTVCEVKLHDNK